MDGTLRAIARRRALPPLHRDGPRMGETANIAKLAEKAFGQIFKPFGWEQRGPTNSSWDCETPSHKVGQHPSDAVFSYQDPYFARRILVNLDFKSYKRSTLEKLDLSVALRGLAMATECANKSETFQERFGSDGDTETVGMLFVFNHDQEYNPRRFDQILAASHDECDIGKKRRMFIAGPGVISYLATVANDIELATARMARHERSFFFPNLIGRPANAFGAATIESLMGPWVIVKFAGAKGDKPETHHNVYYRGKGASPQEFEYLLDYLFRFQVVDDYSRVHFRLVEPATDAAPNLEAAKRVYLGRFHGLREFKERLERIDYESVSRVVQTFSDLEAGMEQRI